MSGREELIGTDHFIYTEVTVGLKKQGPEETDIGKGTNEKIMAEGLTSAMKRATLFKLAVLKLVESDEDAKSLNLRDIESHYRFFEPDQAGFSKIPTWSEASDIEKNFNKSGYVLILDREKGKTVGRTVIHFKNIPTLSMIEKIRTALTQVLEMK